MQSHGPWKIVAQAEVFRDPWITLRHDQVIRPDGLPGTYSVVHIKAGVCVVAVSEGQMHLTEEFHYGVGRVTLEGVSGGCDADELPETAARRELAEELGIIAQKWTYLGCCDPFTSNIVSPTCLYLAEDLVMQRASPEGTEQIRHVVLPVAEAIQRVMDGRISHAPSALLILKIARYLRV